MNLLPRLRKLGRITRNCAGHNMFSRKKFKGKEKNNNKYLSKQTGFLKIRNSYFENTCGEQDTFTQDVKLYIPSTLNIDLILWHTELVVSAVRC